MAGSQLEAGSSCKTGPEDGTWKDRVSMCTSLEMADAATGMYSGLLQSHQLLLRQWEQYGQAKIVLSCKNQQEMNKLKEAADRCGLPTFVVADAGRTQIQAGSRTVLAIGPGNKQAIDSVTGKLRLL